MSLEEHRTAYLRCDQQVDWMPEGRCFVSFGEQHVWPLLQHAYEEMAGLARAQGWKVELLNEGLKGWSASALCPDHAAVPSGRTPDE